MPTVTPFLMFNDQLEDALELYTSVFPDSRIEGVRRAGAGGPVQSATFVVGGQKLLAYNGGAHFTFSEGVSLFVDCQDQQEVDTYWDRLLEAGAQEQMCGWIRDPYGLSWQIIPKRLMELMGDPDPARARAVTDAMLEMVKIDVQALEEAYAAA